MNDMITKQMLKKIREYQEKEEKLQNAMDNFSKLFAPHIRKIEKNYSPF